VRTRSFLATGWVNVGAQAALLALLYAIGRDRTLAGSDVVRHLLLLILVGIPSAIWVLFFYLQDRRRPEPSRYVIAAVLAGMAAAAVFALPIERDVFQTSEWLYRSTTSLALGATLIRGTLTSLLVYAVVRLGFYPSREFDEPVDGMVYGAGAGSGFAVITSLTYLVGRIDFTLFAIGYTASTAILMYASVGALVGYFVGRTKFDGVPRQGRHVVGLLVGAGLTGVYHVAAEIPLTTGAPRALWLSFALTMALSIGVLAAATLVMRGQRGRRITDLAGTATGRGGYVWGCAIALLAVGGIVMQLERRDVVVTSRTPPIAFRYSPSAVSPAPLAHGVSAVSPLVPIVWSGTGEASGPFTITVGARSERVSVAGVDALAYVGTPAPLDLTLSPVTIGGRPGVRARYAYLDASPEAPGVLPNLIWTYTDVVPVDDYTFVFTLEGRPGGFPGQERVYRRLLDSVTWGAR
jgi:protease PrsW